jgi:bacterioferritin-associated ferredoxin
VPRGGALPVRQTLFLITVFIISIGEGEVASMYVCICKAVTDKTVQAAIDDGADTVEAVTRACRAGGDCGSCHDMIEGMIERGPSCQRACVRLPVLDGALVPA